MTDPRSVFTLCREVLEKYPYGKEKIDKRRKKMHDNFFGTEKMGYKTDLTHCAYIRSDVTVHASALSSFIHGNEQLKNFVFHEKAGEIEIQEGGPRETVTIASIGCGPGTDMIGILRYVMGNFSDPERRPKLMFYLYDSVPSWKKAIRHFVHVIRTPEPEPEALELTDDLPWTTIPVPEFQCHFQPWDFTRDPKDFKGVHNFESVDLFTFSTVFSDIFRANAEAQEVENIKKNVKAMCSDAKVGSFFLFMDLDSEKIPNFPLASFFQQTALAGDNFEHVCSHPWSYQLDFDEQKTDLGKYLSGECMPKLGMSLHVNLYRKKQQQLA